LCVNNFSSDEIKTESINSGREIFMKVTPITWYAENGSAYKNCAVFYKVKDTFGGLSNMAGGYPLKFNGIVVESSEALYQACRFPHHPEYQQEIIIQRSPMAAKMMAKKEGRRQKHTRQDWLEIQIELMRWVLRVKLAQHYKRISTLLLQTGERPIVEKSRKDSYWGAVEKKGEEGVLYGENKLGNLLMELRELVKIKPRQELTSVEPLDLSDFLLLGQPIPSIRGVIV
jgi:ribA/ribD-fused uncharacterized protein